MGFKKVFFFIFLCLSLLISAQAPMILEWDFSNNITTELKTKGSATYIMKNTSGFIVASGNLNEGFNTISVPQTGVFTMEISNTSDFTFKADTVDGHPRELPTELRRLIQWGDTNLSTDLSGMFASSVIQITASDIPNFKPNTNLSSMFYGATLFNGDISNWDVSNVTDMSYMFLGTHLFNSDISNWDVSNVTDMSYMFIETYLFNSDISNWNVSNVTHMNYMFADTLSFNGDLSNWDVSNVTDMSYMFFNASAFNKDLSTWNVSNVTNMRSMFAETHSFNGDLSDWDVSNVINMRYMFFSADAFNGDLSNWDVSNVTDMNSMFAVAFVFNGDLSNWNVSSVTDMTAMFQSALAFNSDLSGWDVSNVTDMGYMFYLAGLFNSDLSNWNVSNVTNMANMFDNTGMSCENYGNTLVGWADQDVQSDVVLGASGIQYGSNAVQARATLTNSKNWTITGDSLNENCEMGVSSLVFTSDIQVLNPVKNTIQLITTENIYKVEVYDTSGKKIKEFNGLSSSVSELNKGIYILKIFTPKGIKTYQIIKN